MKIWDIYIPIHALESNIQDYLRLLPKERPSVEWVWKEMDRIWFQLGLNNLKPLSLEAIGKFYQHPVWAMNGLFTMSDPVSVGHRQAIASFLKSYPCSRVADYGGGFGALAKEIVRQNSTSLVSIIEPFPSSLALSFLDDTQRIKFVPDLSTTQQYDIIVAQDVLEHVEDPIGLAFNLSTALRPGGVIIFANCFYPIIQCHLPCTFHLRHTFPHIMRSMELEYLGKIPNAEHALIFRIKRRVTMRAVRKFERISKIIGPLLNLAHPLAGRLKSFILS